MKKLLLGFGPRHSKIRSYISLGSTSSTDPYMFAATSEYRNDGEAGLTHVGARYYDAQVGRFITRDTFLNQRPYQYCNHDPVNCLDPSGHETYEWWQWLEWAGGGMVAGGTISAGLGLYIGVVAAPVGGEVPGVGLVIGGGIVAGIGSVIYVIGWIGDGFAHLPPINAGTQRSDIPSPSGSFGALVKNGNVYYK